MAAVYLARNLKHDRPVALKVLHPELAATLGPERFRRELTVAAKLQHPHILSVFDRRGLVPARSCGGPRAKRRDQAAARWSLAAGRGSQTIGCATSIGPPRAPS
jgi:hypothetical protein